jgi:hypothetical protein
MLFYWKYKKKKKFIFLPGRRPLFGLLAQASLAQLGLSIARARARARLRQEAATASLPCTNDDGS